MIAIYIMGMFVTLFENDSAQFAVMAMRMVQENDFLNLFRGQHEYLDKPHMHYWLAALSYKLFGINHFAYRLPALLATLLGAYGCHGLGRSLYNDEVGKLAALIFMTAQTIVLSVIDVRTDAILTGFTVLAVWQLLLYSKNGSLKHIALGALAAGIAFSTKGQIALLVMGLPLLCHLAYTQKWNVLLHWKVLVALAVFALTIAPMLYAYYHQFDLHPEKIIRGKGDRSGILFIFWEQSFERLSGEGVGKNSSDYFFFFHTFLWVFLPWTVVGLLAYVDRVKAFMKRKQAFFPHLEVLTLGGITFIFIIISFAQFKLPHYLNITIPLFSVLSAGYLFHLYESQKHRTIKFVLGAHYFILGLVFVVSSLLSMYVFRLKGGWPYVLIVIIAIPIIYYSLKKEGYYFRAITVAACSSILLNLCLNAHFYPNLLKYQAGSEMSKWVAHNQVPVDRIYRFQEWNSWGFDFYNKKPLTITTLDAIGSMNDIWVYVDDKGLNAMELKGLAWDRKISKPQFRITRLQAKFLNPGTREKVLNHMHLVHITQGASEEADEN
ncbi:MAG: ArnT family glycosyltransferase [Flavobacteriaceae bacterium]